MTNKHTRPSVARTDVIAKTDPTDVGVPMRPAPAGWTHQGPEDALDPGPKRGNYADRLGETRHTQTEAVLPADAPYETAPTIRAVAQNPHAGNLVLDDPGGPLDAADPNYETLRAQRARGRTA